MIRGTPWLLQPDAGELSTRGRGPSTVQFATQTPLPRALLDPIGVSSSHRSPTRREVVRKI